MRRRKRNFAKQILVLTLTAAMLFGAFDLSALPASAKAEAGSSEKTEPAIQEETKSVMPEETKSTIPEETKTAMPEEAESAAPDGTESAAPDGTKSAAPGEADSDLEMVSGNESEKSDLETKARAKKTEATIYAATAAKVTATTREVSYVYRSYDEASGKVVTETKTETANVLDQTYVNQAAEENGWLAINKDAADGSTALWVVEGDVTVSNGGLEFYGNVILVLADGATLNAEKTYLYCEQLTICGQKQDSGRYVGKTINNYNNKRYSPRLEISGGSIEMKGGSLDNYTYVAIGSHWAYTTVVINGGTVAAEITGDRVAIGGTGNSQYTDEDKKDNFGSVEIHGGKVTAVTDNLKGNTNNAAAIGRGDKDSKGSVIITGGTVEATNAIKYEYLTSTTPAICAGDMQIKNVKLQGYGDDEASAETGKLSYLYRETALTKHYISLTECTHVGGNKKYVSGQSILEGCVDCGANENLCYTLTGFTLDGSGETLAEERQYGEKQTILAAVLQGADGKPVTENVTWKWYDNDAAIPGATGSTYIAPLNLAAGTHVFRAEATLDGLTLTGDAMTVTVNRRTVGIDWGQTEFYYDSKTEYIIDPKLTDVVEGDEVSLEFDTTGYYTVTINGTEYKDKKFPAKKHSEVGTYCNAVELTGTAKDNYILENGKDYALHQWSVGYFTDEEASLSGTLDENGNYTGRVKLTAPEGMLLHVDGKNVKFQYYSEEGSHTVSYYLVKEGATQYRAIDRTVNFTIAGDGSQSNTGEVGRIQKGDIVYFGTYDEDFSGDAYSTEGYFGEPVAWRVLDAGRTNVDTTDGMFVISEKGLGSRHSGYYLESDGIYAAGWYTGQSYAGGGLNGWCDDFQNGKYAQRLTAQERQLLKGTQKVKGDRNASLDKNHADSYGFTWETEMTNQGGVQFLYTNLNEKQPKIFLPSVEEVGLKDETITIGQDSNNADVEFLADKDGYFTSEEDRKIEEGAYWLRNWRESREQTDARYRHSYNFAQINADGKYGTGTILFANTLSAELQMRPAANVLFSKIWFLSAVGGKSDGKFNNGLAAYSVPDDTDHWKITMKDSTATQFEAKKENLDENQLTVSYSNARTGENRYLSAVVEDENGTVTFYGRLKALNSDTDKSGEVTFDLPTDVAQGNKVFVYEEQFNGDYLVDYAGPLVQVHQVRIPDVTVGEKTDLVYDGTKQELVTLEELKYGTIQYRIGTEGAWGSEIPKAKNAGDYTVYYWVKGDDMYDNVGSRKNPKSVDVTVSPKELGVVWGETKLTYNGAEQAPTAEPDPEDLVAGDQVTLTVSQKGQSRGDYTAVAALSDADTNYVLRSQSVHKEFTISPKPVTVTITSQGGVYGGSNPGVKAVLNGIEAVDENEQLITLTYTGTSYNGNSVDMKSTPTDAGEYAVKVSLTNDNYSLTGETSAQYHVAARDIANDEITVDPITKSFQGIGNSVRLEYIDIQVTDTNPDLNPYLVEESDYTLTDDYTDNDRISTAKKPAKVKIAGCGNYTGEREVPFQIVYEAGINDKVAAASTDLWTKDAVTITAPAGYRICLEKTGSYDYDKDFTANVTIDSESASSAGTTVSYYLQNPVTKAVSEKKELVVKIDRTAPVFGEKEGIRIKNSFWNKLLSVITFGLYTKSEDTVTITASDSPSGIRYYYYFVDNATDKADYKVLTAAELKTKAFTQSADGKFRIEEEGKKVVYAYVEDQAGNQSTYICSDGIVVDNIGPRMDVKVDESEKKDISAKVNFRMDEEGTIYYLLSQTKLSGNPSVESLKTLPGVESKDVTEEMAGKIQVLDFSGLFANTTYYLYAAAEDRAGNTCENVYIISFTTLKTIPYIEIAPVLTGTYGATLEAMIQTDNARVVAAKGSTTVLDGTWSVTEDAQKQIYPVAGGTQAYSLTFTPTGADANVYSTVSCESVPVVAPKSVKVGISPATRSYGEVNPAFDYSVEADGLVSGDKKEALGISLRTDAEETSDVGIYEIRGSWTNNNYNVTFMGLDSNGDWTIAGHGNLVITQAANTFVTALSCKDITYKEAQVSPQAEARFGAVKYLYAKKTGQTEPDDSAYSSEIPSTAGDYYVKAYVEETANYKGVNSQAFPFSIKKAAAPAVMGDTVQVTYVNGKEASIALDKKLPEDKGETVYTVTQIADQDQILGNISVDTDGNLSYQVRSTTDTACIGKTASITVTISMQNYEDAQYTLSFLLTEKKSVELAAGCEVLKGSRVLRYGTQLKKLSLNTSGKGRAVFVDQDTKTEVPGRLEWKQPDLAPTVDTVQAEWIFIPDDATQYAELTGYVTIEVQKAVPTVTAPAAGRCIYNPQNTLSNVSLLVSGENGKATAYIGDTEKEVTGSWEWTDEYKDSVIPATGKRKYEAVFVPGGADAVNFESVKAMVVVNVEKALPYIDTVPDAGAITYGQSLKKSVITGGMVLYGDGQGQAGSDRVIAGTFRWQDGTVKPAVADSNKTQYKVVFVPKDTANYKSVECTVQLTVKKAAFAPGMPGKTKRVPYKRTKVGDVKLPAGWEWKTDDQDKALAPGVAVIATAIYTGADKGNYETESVEITITRGDKATQAIPKPEGETQSDEKPADGVKPMDGVKDAGGSRESDPADRTNHNSQGTAGTSDTGNSQNKGSQLPYVKGNVIRNGWDAIGTAVKAAEEGENLIVDMNGTTMVPGDIFEAIRGKDVTLVLDMGGDILWSVNGKDVEADKIGNIDFAVTTGEKAGRNIPVEVINKVTGERYSMNLTLVYDGEFGFTATLAINMGEKNADLYANLFFYNEEAGALEFVCADKIDEQGSVKLAFTGGPDYTIVIDEQSMEQADNPAEITDMGSQTDTESAVNPDDGEEKEVSYLWLLLISVVAVIAVTGIFFIVRKKEES